LEGDERDEEDSDRLPRLHISHAKIVAALHGLRKIHGVSEVFHTVSMFRLLLFGVSAR
jgi:hypothetical protein